MNEILVVGHKSPDTDSIGSAIACAYLYNNTGHMAKPVRAGEINKETRFALNYFGLLEPPLCTELTKDQQVVLVDHNERKQSIDGISEADVVALIDHHRLGDFETEKPIFICIEPVGCTSTILFGMFERAHVSIPREIAGMMLSAIISDTLLFRSPTCTERDRLAVKALADLAGVDYEEYGMSMLKAGADVSDIPLTQWVQTDKKEFVAGEQTFSVAQLSVMDTTDVLVHKKELHQLMEADRLSHGYLASFLMVTNILKEETDLLFVGDANAWVSRAFHAELSEGSVHLPGVMSRKKQIIPPLLGAV